MLWILYTLQCNVYIALSQCTNTSLLSGSTIVGVGNNVVITMDISTVVLDGNVTEVDLQLKPIDTTRDISPDVTRGTTYHAIQQLINHVIYHVIKHMIYHVIYHVI